MTPDKEIPRETSKEVATKILMGRLRAFGKNDSKDLVKKEFYLVQQVKEDMPEDINGEGVSRKDVRVGNCFYIEV